MLTCATKAECSTNTPNNYELRPLNGTTAVELALLSLLALSATFSPVYVLLISFELPRLARRHPEWDLAEAEI